MKNTLLYFTLLFFELLPFANVNAQPPKKETKEAYAARMQKMTDSIKNARMDAKNNKPVSGSSGPGNVSTGKYSTKKSNIENSYNFLSAEEKEKVKNFPVVPEAFRTNEDAQDFLNKLNDIDFNASIAKYFKEKSARLTLYCIAFQGVQNKAETIVTESANLKAAFEKINPTVNFGTTVGKTYVSETSLVYLPLGKTSFADEVIDVKYLSGNIQFDKENVLQTPDYVLMKKLSDNKGIYSLGTNGSITIKFNDNALVDVNGPDLYIFEAGEIEPTNLEISKDGINWINVGEISGGTAAVDINKYVKPNEYFYYVRLTDKNTQSTVAGADIDAIAAIGAAIRLSLGAEVLFDLGKTTLKADGIAEVKKLAVQLQSIPSALINIDGFTDDIGKEEANIKLSLERAQAVAVILKQELVSKKGFIYSESGKGKSNPVAPNTSENNRQKNRRVEIIVTPK